VDRPVGCAKIPRKSGEDRSRRIAGPAKSRQASHDLSFFRLPKPALAVATELAIVVGILTAACGPSVQYIYESNLRFEHCYRLDYDQTIAPSHRHACWVDWVDRFAKGQTRDRVEYAVRRIAAIDSGDGAALTLHVGENADAGPVAARAAPAPAPTNVHAPPPAVIQAPFPSPPDAGDPPPASAATSDGDASTAIPAQKPAKRKVRQPARDH
jgi:hypothetical protein